MKITSILKPQKYWLNSTTIVNKLNKRRISFDNIGSVKHYNRNGKLNEKNIDKIIDINIDENDKKQQINKKLGIEFVNFFEKKIIRNITTNHQLLKKHLIYQKTLDLKSLTDIIINIKNKFFMKKFVVLFPRGVKIPAFYRRSLRIWLLKIGRSEEEASVRIQSVYRGIKARKLYRDKKTVNDVMKKLIDDCIVEVRIKPILNQFN